MKQSDIVFSSILTKIGDMSVLTDDELNTIQSRFFSQEDADRLCPHGIRIFHTNNEVANYNHSILNNYDDKVNSTAVDVYIGCTNAKREANCRQKVHRLYVIDTGGLPQDIVLVKDKPYIITTNIDVVDGLANGAVGKLHHIEFNDDGAPTPIWLLFPASDKNVGQKTRKKGEL